MLDVLTGLYIVTMLCSSMAERVQERKKAVKEAQRDKRKTKVPKYQKKRREKMAKTKKH